MNIIKSISKKFATGVLVCLSAAAAMAATVTVEIPAAGGTVNSDTVSNEGGKWYFNGAGRPCWVSKVVLRKGGSSVTLGTGTMTYGTQYDGYFTVTAAANTGAARSWTWDILSAKGGSTVVTLVVNQAGVEGEDKKGGDDAGSDDEDDWDDGDCDADEEEDEEEEEEEEEVAPISFAVTASKGTYDAYVMVTWKKGEGAKSYKVYRSTEECFESASLLGQTTKRTWTDKSVTAGKKYWYFVCAVDADGVEHENEMNDYGSSKAVKISVPTPKATDGSYEGYVKLTWSAVSGVQKYYVYRSTTTSFSDATCIGYATKASASDKTAALGTKYYYWICPLVGENVYYKKSGYDAGFRKVTLTVTTPKSVKVGQTKGLTLKVNGTVVTSGPFTLTYSAKYLTAVRGSGNSFCKITGKKAGTTTLKVVYGTTAAATVSWKVSVTK